MIRIIPDPLDRVVLHQFVDLIPNGPLIADGAAGQVSTVWQMIGHQSHKIIPHEGNVVAHGARALCAPHNQRGDNVAVRRKDSAKIDEILFLVFSVTFVGTRGIDRPVRSDNHGIGGSTGLTAFSRALEIQPTGNTEHDNNHNGYDDLEYLIQDLSSILKIIVLLYNHRANET
jgi:hypothetical protein